MNTDSSHGHMTIELPGAAGEEVYVESLAGREALGRTYRFEISLLSKKPIDLESMLGKAAKLTLQRAGESVSFLGVIGSARTGDPTSNREFSYHVVIEPELAMLRHSAQNQVYGTDKDVTVVDIIQGELADANKAGSNTASSRVARQIQSELLIAAADYPKLDFVFQYRENDLNFLCRMCERFGIYFAFDHSEDREKVVFGDRKEHFSKLSGSRVTDELAYRSRNQALGTDSFGIWSFNAHYETSSGTVALREYNEDTPKVSLSVSEDASYAGQGVTTCYGENYPVVPDGQFIARRRVDQFEGQRLQFRGESNVPNLRPGLFFRLKDHPVSGLDGLYTVISVEHACTTSTPIGFSSAEKQPAPYTNRFVCVPFDKGYRPPMVTPKPVVSGYMVAFVDGEADGSRAELDDSGRYKVRIPDEESGLLNGKASHFVRKMEPYGGGDGYGSHSTLLKGTEVLIGFLQGDPDRPVILGAVSNGEQINPVTSANQTVAHRMKTASGVVFQINDGPA
ncbi:type VI secretion system Vgr family protein [Roseibium marinum]|uniref:Type VI secretion system secreted protein VgrG n=1 Tax=Roseibium marinum TaxID=281252 RepID=A0A2S3V1X4_9HYPH|nr:type VI secretion system Vgr family protein [Roseibium marinum]POF33783.1 type VI secretion system secreted protein VgrG [Roseibium marinum]